MVDNEQNQDINEIFDDIFFAEEKIVEKSFEEGYKIGIEQENVEAYHLGYHRGAEIGAELGYYSSFIEYYQNFSKEKGIDVTDKVLKTIITVQELIGKFPEDNDENTDLKESLNNIRVKYRRRKLSILKMNSIQLVQYHVEKLLLHLEPLLPLANCHMVDFFTKDIFKTYISPEIRSEINSMSHTQVIENIFSKNFTNLPVLGEYFESSKACSLLENGDVCLTLEKFYDKLESFGCKDINGLKLNIFMSQKKSHEVEILSSIVASLKEIGDASHIIDVGDGKGYLSSMLALHHKIPVLGIDASPNNSKAAVERVQKLEKIWHSVYDNPKKSVPKKDDRNCTPSDHLYKQVTKYVEPDKNFVKNAADVFEEEIRGVSLVGLHTCGNLGPTCLRIFNEDPSIKTLSNVGCCYHLMNEKYESDCGEHLSGFPMSDYLNKKKCTIGRNARMVASQSINRIFSNKELPDMSIFYRALLQLVLETKCKELPTRTVGKTRKKFNTNFVEYTRMALKKLELNADDLNISDDYLKNLYNEYEARLSELNIFYLIRCMTSPVTESLIILDRLLFLLEQGYDNSFLVQLFDPVVSPRCFGVISLKI